MMISAFARSRVVATGFGAYGAAMQVYSHFLARGHDVVYPKDMSMVIGLGTREKQKTQGTRLFSSRAPNWRLTWRDQRINQTPDRTPAGYRIRHRVPRGLPGGHGGRGRSGPIPRLMPQRERA